MIFTFETTIRPDWIDYNGHMQDAFYGLVFSYAVDALQDEVGFDAAYRAATGCTVYLLESHVFFLREVRRGALVTVDTCVIGLDDKRFHLHATMREAGATVAVGEFMEAHVRQRPAPKVVPMPEEVHARLHAALQDPSDLPRRARSMGLIRKGG
jgi:acyl-CoA thioester hydrolase